MHRDTATGWVGADNARRKKGSLNVAPAAAAAVFNHCLRE
jgi:hypothetical protein